MALLEDVSKLEGAAGPVVLGVGFLFAPTLLPAVGRVLRPLAKEVIKAGIVAYDEASGAVSGAYEAAGDLVAEARAERESQGAVSDGEGPHRATHRRKRRVEPRQDGSDEIGATTA